MKHFKPLLILPILTLFLTGFNSANALTKAQTTKVDYILGKKEIIVLVIDKNASQASLDATKKELEALGLEVSIKGVKRNKQGEIRAIKIQINKKNSSTSYATSSDEPIQPIQIKYNSEDDAVSIGSVKHKKKQFVFESNDNNHTIHRFNGDTIYVTTQKHLSKLNDEDAKIIIKKYGKAGKTKTIKKVKNITIIEDDANNENIEINIEKDSTNHKAKTIVIDNTWVSNDNDDEAVIILRSSGDYDNNISITKNSEEPLIIVDGEQVANQKAHNLKPNQIESVSVLKGKAAKAKYGKKGKHGVIEITTKKEE